jgi:hypothetical protein
MSKIYPTLLTVSLYLNMVYDRTLSRNLTYVANLISENNTWLLFNRWLVLGDSCIDFTLKMLLMMLSLLQLIYVDHYNYYSLLCYVFCGN